MKKPFFLFCLAAMFLAIVPSCKKSDDSGSLQSVKISPASLKMQYGESKNLRYSITPTDASVTSEVWSVADPSVATVTQDGKVTVISLPPASTTVKVTLNGNISDSISVEVTDKGYLTPEGAITYLDYAGQSALAQVVPQDFKNLAYILEDALTAYIGKGTVVKQDRQDTVQWNHQISHYWEKVNATGGGDYYFNGLYGKATLVLKPDDSYLHYRYADYEKSPISFDVDSKTKYTGNLTMDFDKKGSIRLGKFRTRKNTMKDTLYTYLPITADASISFDGKVYAKIALKTDFSKMAGMDLSLFDPLFDYGDLNFSINESDISINGTNSYRIRINKFSVAEKKIADSLVLFGQNGDSLMTFSGKSHFDDESTIFIPVLVSDGWSIDLQNGNLIVKCAADGKITIYMAGYAEPQMTIDGTGENRKVTFADETVKSYDEVFTASNFSQTVSAAIDLLAEFIRVFRSTIY